MRYARMERAKIFSSIYKEKTWTGNRSDIPISGRGSMLSSTHVLRAGLGEVFETYAIHSIVDVGCGDFTWMQKMNLNELKYVGTEIVSGLVQANQKRFGSHTVKFIELDICKESLPNADLIFCRDCLVHLSFNEVSAALKNIQLSDATYLLATTFKGLQANKEIVTGLWRPINLEIAPFNLGAPQFYLMEDDQTANTKFIEKTLGFWKLK